MITTSTKFSYTIYYKNPLIFFVKSMKNFVGFQKKILDLRGEYVENIASLIFSKQEEVWTYFLELRIVGVVEILMLYATKNMAMLQLIKMVKTKINF